MYNIIHYIRIHTVCVSYSIHIKIYIEHRLGMHAQVHIIHSELVHPTWYGYF